MQKLIFASSTHFKNALANFNGFFIENVLFPLIALEKTETRTFTVSVFFSRKHVELKNLPKTFFSMFAAVQRKRSLHEFFIEILLLSEVILNRKAVNKAKRAKNLSARKKVAKNFFSFFLLHFFSVFLNRRFCLFFLTEKKKN